MLIGEVADRAAVPAKTIRYYESIGLLPAAERGTNGYRQYPEAIVHRLAFIRAAQACGFTLGEIRGIVAFRDRGDAPCEHVRDLIDRHADAVDRRIAELHVIKRELARLARRARLLDPTRCAPAAVCHIIGPSADPDDPVRRGQMGGRRQTIMPTSHTR